MKWVLAVGLGVLGAAVGTVVGISGPAAGGQATAASLSGDPTGMLDPVLNQGTKDVLKALDQGLALVLKDKGGSASFQAQETSWSQMRESWGAGESNFVNASTKASNQFLSGVFSGGDPTDDLIQLLKLISGYQTKVSNAAAGWDQTPSRTAYDLQVAKKTSVGKNTIASGLKGATQLTQTVAKAEVALYEKVAIAEIEYEGGILDSKTAVTQIDAAFIAFEQAITGGAKMVVKGAPVSWNTVVQKQVTPVATTWNIAVNKTSTGVINGTPQTVNSTTVTTTTTVTAPRTTVTITCPTPPNGDWWTPSDPITVTGSVSPPVAGATVTMSYNASPTGTSTTDTDTTAANGTFTDSAIAPPTTEPYAQSIQATDGGVTSNACPAEFAGG